MKDAQQTLTVNIEFDKAAVSEFLDAIRIDIKNGAISLKEASQRVAWFRDNIKLFCRLAVA